MMSGKVRSRATANAPDSLTQSTNEKILKECHALYTDNENGLVKIAKSVSLSLLAPRKKITVLLIGNHSAGKSSFINWYIEEHVQRTGVAIETQGFAFVTSGRKRESLTGPATLHLYPHFEPLTALTGVVEYLNTEVSTSKQKKFSLVTFVDTPGLVDGDMKYPFDVNKSILWLGDLADLIFVFFDPIGQALCKRTLNIVEKLNIKHADRMRFYLSKADEAGHESDRQRVMMQIVQELCKRPGLNRTGFDMPTIYVPNPNKPCRCVNQIEDVCKDIEKTINQTVQNTLNSLEKDCCNIMSLVDDKLATDTVSKSLNIRRKLRGWLLTILALILPIALVLSYLLGNRQYHHLVVAVLGRSYAENLALYLAPVHSMWALLPPQYGLYGIVGIIMLVLLLLFLSRTRSLPTLSRKEKRQLTENRDYVITFVKAKKEILYQEYLKQSVAEHDL